MDVRYHAGRTIRHVGSLLLEGALIVGIVGGLVLGVALTSGNAPLGAGEAYARGGSSIWIDESSYRTSSPLTFGQEMRFGYRSDTATSIQLHCYKSGTLVFADFRMLFEGGMGYGEPFVLGPSASWTGGAADCKGMLGHRTKSGKYMVEDSVTFDVAP